MRDCLGKLGWSPREFWDASLTEIWDAMEGLAEFNSGGKEDEGAPTQDEFDEAALLEAEGKANGDDRP